MSLELKPLLEPIYYNSHKTVKKNDIDEQKTTEIKQNKTNIVHETKHYRLVLIEGTYMRFTTREGTIVTTCAKPLLLSKKIIELIKLQQSYQMRDIDDNIVKTLDEIKKGKYNGKKVKKEEIQNTIEEFTKNIKQKDIYVYSLQMYLDFRCEHVNDFIDFIQKITIFKSIPTHIKLICDHLLIDYNELLDKKIEPVKEYPSLL